MSGGAGSSPVGELLEKANNYCDILASQFDESGKYNEATIEALKSEVVEHPLFENLDLEDRTIRADVLGYIGKYYFINHEYDSSWKYFTEAHGATLDEEKRKSMMIGYVRSSVEQKLSYQPDDLRAEKVPGKLIKKSTEALRIILFLESFEGDESSYAVERNRANCNLAIAMALQDKYQDALNYLEAARKGLDLVEDLDRVIAAEFPKWLILSKLGRKAEATEVIAKLLRETPKGAITHERFVTSRKNWLSILSHGADKSAELATVVSMLMTRFAERDPAATDVLEAGDGSSGYSSSCEPHA